jgi:hypothetical protein
MRESESQTMETADGPLPIAVFGMNLRGRAATVKDRLKAIHQRLVPPSPMFLEGGLGTRFGKRACTGGKEVFGAGQSVERTSFS